MMMRKKRRGIGSDCESVGDEQSHSNSSKEYSMNLTDPHGHSHTLSR
jgi:hypothetical protein